MLRYCPCGGCTAKDVCPRCGGTNLSTSEPTPSADAPAAAQWDVAQPQPLAAAPWDVAQPLPARAPRPMPAAAGHTIASRLVWRFTVVLVAVLLFGGAWWMTHQPSQQVGALNRDRVTSRDLEPESDPTELAALIPRPAKGWRLAEPAAPDTPNGALDIDHVQETSSTIFSAYNMDRLGFRAGYQLTYINGRATLVWSRVLQLRDTGAALSVLRSLNNAPRTSGRSRVAGAVEGIPNSLRVIVTLNGKTGDVTHIAKGSRFASVYLVGGPDFTVAERVVLRAHLVALYRSL